MKVFCVSGLRRATAALLVLFAAGGLFAQANDVYTEAGSDVITKKPVKGAPPIFGGFYNKTRALLVFDRFWLDTKLSAILYSSDEWESCNFGLLGGDTYLNVGFVPAWHSEIVLGTDYDKVVPGTYLYAYDDVLPDARFGNTGATYVFSGLKPMLGLSMALSIPFQYRMFTDDSGVEMNAAVYFESDFGVNVGTRMTMDFADDFSIGAYLAGGTDSALAWMAGYTYKGTGFDGRNPANHYIDTSAGLDMGAIYLGADFEIGFGGADGARPLYAGLLAKVIPFSSVTTQISALYSVSNTKDYSASVNTLTFKPKVTFGMDDCEVGMGAEIMVLDAPLQETAVGLAFPVYIKYWF